MYIVVEKFSLEVNIAVNILAQITWSCYKILISTERIGQLFSHSLTLIRAAMKIDVAVRLEVIYDFSGDQ